MSPAKSPIISGFFCCPNGDFSLYQNAHLCAKGWDSSDAESVKAVCGESNPVRSYLGIGQPNAVGMTFQEPAIRLNCNGAGESVCLRGRSTDPCVYEVPGGA